MRTAGEEFWKKEGSVSVKIIHMPMDSRQIYKKNIKSTVMVD